MPLLPKPAKSTTPSPNSPKATETEVDQLMKTIWGYVYSFADSPPMNYPTKTVLKVLIRAEEILASEPTVLDLTGSVIIFGDIQGQADSLLSFFTVVDLPPKNVLLFLGNYAGQGFAPIEVLLFLLCMKVKFPKHVYLLKGQMERTENLKANDFIEGLYQRGLFNTSMVWQRVCAALGQMPIAAVLTKKFFCVHGGIGKQLMKHGLKRLRKVAKPAKSALDQALEKECVWAAYREPKPNKPVENKDGCPVFVAKDVEKFCVDNKLKMIIRSRQVVMDGVLQRPKKMLTVWTAQAYMDNFRNLGAILSVDSIRNKMIVSRIRVMEEDPKSLDEIKPPNGRNVIIIG